MSSAVVAEAWSEKCGVFCNELCAKMLKNELHFSGSHKEVKNAVYFVIQ